MSVRMSDAEPCEFLSGHHTATLVTLNPDGTPLPTPVWYVNDGTTVFFRTLRKTQKAKNLVRDPRAAVQIEDGQRFLELRCAILHGMAEEMPDSERLAWFALAFQNKYQGRSADASQLPAATRAHYAVPQVCYRLVPTRIASWDNRKLRRSATALRTQR